MISSYYLSLLLLYLLFLAAASLLFVHLKKNFFVLVPVHFCNLFNNFFVQYKQTRATMGVKQKPYEGLHIMFYTRRSTHVRFISCDGQQLYDFKECGVDLEVEGVRYVEMHRRPHTYWARLLQGAEISMSL